MQCWQHGGQGIVTSGALRDRCTALVGGWDCSAVLIIGWKADVGAAGRVVFDDKLDVLVVHATAFRLVEAQEKAENRTWRLGFLGILCSHTSIDRLGCRAVKY
jgi:hypothetical protein